MEAKLRHSLFEILDGITSINENLQGLGYDDYRTSRRTMIEVVDNLEKIMQAIHFLPDYEKDSIPQIPWDRFDTLHEYLVHPIMGVDEELVWKTAKSDLRDLKKSILTILKGSDVTRIS